MAVFTPVAHDEAAAFFEGYALKDTGAFTALDPISEGVENTNYRVSFEKRRFVLTLFERRSRAEDVEKQLALCEHLADAGLPAPRPERTPDGVRLRSLNGRPAALIEWREGKWTDHHSPAQLVAGARMLARMNAAAVDFAPAPPNRFGLSFWKETAAQCAAKSPTGAAAEILAGVETEIAALEPLWPEGLPETTIHGDYFPDNVLYTGDDVTGVIDVYFAGREMRVYDLGVALNAWGFDAKGVADAERLKAFGAAYAAEAELSPAERAAVPIMCRGAAARFTLSRLIDLLTHDDSWLVTPKDPGAFFARIAWHQNAAPADYGL